ncbi:MAG: hypothetical protein ABI355_08840 [Solirubrobacteraceae bacterium]
MPTLGVLRTVVRLLRIFCGGIVTVYHERWLDSELIEVPGVSFAEFVLASRTACQELDSPYARPSRGS